MIPHVHFNPDKTTTYMTDKTKVRLLFDSASASRMLIADIEIKAAYLHEQFDHSGCETLYVRQHPRFDRTYTHPHKGDRLDKNICCTPGAGHKYLNAVFRLLKKHRFQQSEADMCLFHRREKEPTIIFSIDMDDFTIIRTCNKLKAQLAAMLATAYNIKN